MYVIEVPGLNLDHIYYSDQPVRWTRYGECKYIIQHDNNILRVEQKKERLAFDCSEEEFYSIWFKYFDLTLDYVSLFNTTCAVDKTMKVYCTRAKGMRVIQQKFYEVLVYQSLGNDQLFEILLSELGCKHKNSKGDAGKIVWYEFPTPEVILRNKEYLLEIDDEYEWMLYAVKCYKDGILSEDLFRGKTDQWCYDYLRRYLDDDVAANVCLFGLNCKSIYPEKDVASVLTRDEYDCTIPEFRKLFLNDRCQGYEGLVLLQLKYNVINPPASFEGAIIYEFDRRHKKGSRRKQH